MEKRNWRVRQVQALPISADLFAEIEASNVPAVFLGAVKDWPAQALWDPSKGGLQHVKDLAGSAMVQAMATTAGSNFYGDIRGHERVPISFGAFVDLAEKSLTSGMHENDQDMPMSFDEVGVTDREHYLAENTSGFQLYLAQVGIYSQDGGAFPPLAALMGDLAIPDFLAKPVQNINLWMSVNGSRSSTHYDPHQNLLCVVAGSKRVKLWPPSAAPTLYPLPIYGEASNHSAVDFVNPDLATYPRFREALEAYETVTLDVGDALFIPEGWYHQVDSANVTIAVNFWWESESSAKLGTHMDAYLLRRVLANLVDLEKEKMIKEVSKLSPLHVMALDVQASQPPDKCLQAHTLKLNNKAMGRISGEETKALATHQADQITGPAENSKTEEEFSSVRETPSSSVHGNVPHVEANPLVHGPGRRKYVVENLTATESEYLRTLVLSVSTSTPTNNKAGGTAGKHGEVSSANIDMKVSDCTLNDGVSKGFKGSRRKDCIAEIFSALDPRVLQRLMLVMVSEFPRTFEALILNGLSPAASELLTRRFEEMDTMSELGMSQAEFYEHIYSVFDNPRSAMAALLDGKESFAALALKRVMDCYLGLSCNSLPH
ncbi:unnamed protein product [Sphagnum jensenii]|uniref:JmjC domain-containing protein n=1 Tax=Sphagnum jensenii TaxID=128206 RepID=A0ABP0W567_9BRYO